MTDQFIKKLYELKAEAEAAHHDFLVHILGLAILEAHNITGTPNEGRRPDGDGHA